MAAVQAPEGEFDGAWARTFNVFCYFTVQSNVLVAVSTGLLALRIDRPQLWFRVVRLTAVVAITVTFLVYQTVLRGLRELTGLDVYADAALHTVSPVLCVAGWLFIGPRGGLNRRVVAMTLIFPLAWGAFTLARGPIVDFYPYPFIDVAALGYVRVLVNVALVGLLFATLAAGAAWADRRLPGVGDTRAARDSETMESHVPDATQQGAGSA
jgi:hypothetical protein